MAKRIGRIEMIDAGEAFLWFKIRESFLLRK